MFEEATARRLFGPTHQVTRALEANCEAARRHGT